MSTRMIRMSRIVDAPPDRVYRAWSDPETMRQTYAWDGSYTSKSDTTTEPGSSDAAPRATRAAPVSLHRPSMKSDAKSSSL